MAAAWDILYRVNLSWYYLGQNCQNSFWFRTKETASFPTIPDEMNSLNSQIGGFLAGNLRNMMSNQVQLLGHTIVNLNGPQFYQIVNTYTNVFGNNTSPGLPSFCSSVIGWYTAYRGRRVHGRTYIPGVPQALVAGNDLTATGQSILDSTARGILNNFSHDAGFSYPFLVVYSKKNGNGISPGPPPSVTYNPLMGVPATRYVIDRFICTQRHRFEGRGI